MVRPIISQMNSTNGPARWCSATCVGACVIALTACAPALNWRDVRVPGGELSALFPCKPDHFVRQVALAGAPRQMHLSSCAAAGSTYAVSHIEVADAAQRVAVSQALRALAADNIGGVVSVVGPYTVRGTTVQAPAEQLTVAGQRRDGSTLRAALVLFVKDRAVYQATVIGDQPNADAVDTFFAALKLP